MSRPLPPTVGDAIDYRADWERGVDSRLTSYGDRLTAVEGDLRKVMEVGSRTESKIDRIGVALTSLEIKAGTYGTIPAKTVVVICISLVALFVSAVGVSVTVVSIVGSLALRPVIDKLTEEIADRKLTDIEVSKLQALVSSIQSTQKASGERMDGLDERITENKEWLLEKSDDTRLLLDAMNIQSMLNEAASRDEAFLRVLQEIANGRKD